MIEALVLAAALSGPATLSDEQMDSVVAGYFERNTYSFSTVVYNGPALAEGGVSASSSSTSE